MVKMSDFEFDTDLLISLVESRPVFWDNTDDIYKDRNETKKSVERSLYLPSGRLRSSR